MLIQFNLFGYRIKERFEFDTLYLVIQTLSIKQPLAIDRQQKTQLQKRQPMNRRHLTISLLILLLTVFYQTKSVDFQQVKDEQSWYYENDPSKQQPIHNLQTKVVSEQTIQQATNNSADNQQYPNYQKLLSVQRQIRMSEEMVKLYEQRLLVLRQLRNQLKKQVRQDKIKQTYEKQSSHDETQKQVQARKQQPERNYENQSKDTKTQKEKLNKIDTKQASPSSYSAHTINQKRKQSASYLLLSEQSLPISMNRNDDVTQTQDQNQQTSESAIINSPKRIVSIKDSVVLVPPFLINKRDSFVAIVDQNQQVKSTNRYEFGSTSNRLLFYSLQKSLQTKQRPSSSLQQSEQQPPSIKQTLYLALQIKPNKIKSVKLTYNHPPSPSNSSISPLQISQQVTSYQSHQLINQNFKWHNALDFENLIIGFVDSKVYIKGKDMRIYEIQIGSKVLDIYSLNQYKVLFVAENGVGTVNVRSLLVSDQIKFQYYLGNRTLIKQKQMEKQRERTSKDSYEENEEEDYHHHEEEEHPHSESSSIHPKKYWDSPSSSEFRQIRAVSVLPLEQTKQFLILMSNGDLLLHSNEKISAYTNLGNTLMKQLDFQTFHQHQQISDGGSGILERTSIRMDMVPSFKHLIVHSNWHRKLLVFNVTIPYFTVTSNKGAGLGLFASATRATQLNSKYWLALDFDGNSKQASIELNKLRVPASSSDRQLDNEFYLHVASPLIRSSLPEYVKPSNPDERLMFVYHCHFQQEQQKGQSPQQGTTHQNQPSINNQHSPTSLTPLPPTLITISKYRILLNLFDQYTLDSSDLKGPSSSGSTASEGRSYWWNILMVAMIIGGVLLFRKCKSSSGRKEVVYDWDDPEMVERLGKGKNTEFPSGGMRKKPNKLPTKQQQPTPEQKPQQKPTPPANTSYNDKVLTELQSYLQKQGQKLTKQEIAYLVQEMQENQDHQSQETKPPMKREETKDEREEERSLGSKVGSKEKGKGDHGERKSAVGGRDQKNAIDISTNSTTSANTAGKRKKQ